MPPHTREARWTTCEVDHDLPEEEPAKPALLVSGTALVATS